MMSKFGMLASIFGGKKLSINQDSNIPLLKSFDVERLRKELIKNTKIFGIGCVFVMKRCFWFLLGPIFNLFLAIVILSSLLVVTYYQFFEESEVIFSILLSLYGLFALQWLIITIRKIYSSVKYDYTIYFHYSDDIAGPIPNPDLEFILEEENKFSSFLKHSMISFFMQGGISILSLFLGFFYLGLFKENIVLSILQVFLNAYFIYLMYAIFKRIIDFEMDFSLITPESITTYSQTGLFTSQDKTLKHNQIKSLSREQSGWIKTFFDFGEIHIKGVGDDTSARPSIILNHVRNSERVKNMIAQIQRGSIMFNDPETTAEDRKQFGISILNTFYKNNIPEYVVQFLNMDIEETNSGKEATINN